MEFLGEKLDDNEVAEVVKDCMDPEDDDGMIPYARKYLLFVCFVKYYILLYVYNFMRIWSWYLIC